MNKFFGVLHLFVAVPALAFCTVLFGARANHDYTNIEAEGPVLVKLLQINLFMVAVFIGLFGISQLLFGLRLIFSDFQFRRKNQRYKLDLS